MSFIDDDNIDDLALDFVPAEVKRTNDIVPAGDYLVEVETIKAKANGDEDIVNFCPTLVIVEGQYEGRKIFARHCGKTTRTGEKAEKMLQIGKAQLGELARACGVADANLRPCIGQRVIAKVAVRKGSNGYEDSNQVNGYKPVAGAVAATKTKEAAAGAAPADNKPSFMKR